MKSQHGATPATGQGRKSPLVRPSKHLAQRAYLTTVWARAARDETTLEQPVARKSNCDDRIWARFTDLGLQAERPPEHSPTHSLTIVDHAI